MRSRRPGTLAPSPFPTLRALALVLVVGFFALPLPSRADIITLANGRKIEGKIVGEDAEYVRIETKTGTQSIAREDIAKIEKIADPKADFAAKKKALEAKRTGATSREWYDLGQWASEKGMEADAKGCYEAVLKIDPDHMGARQKLGYERVGGVWLPFAEAQKKKGLVEHEGRWVKPEEKERYLQGYVQDADGSWVKKEVIEARKAAEEEKRRRLADAEKEAARLRREREQAKRELKGGGKPPSGGAGGEAGQPLPPATPGEPPSDQALASMIEAQKARARGAEQVVGVTFEDVEEGPLLVHTTHDRKSEKLLQFLKDLGKIYKEETKIYNLPFDAKIWPGKLQIFFFKDKSEFDTFATRFDDAGGAVQSGGYFIHGGTPGSYTKFHIAMYNLELGTLAHEVSHAFMARYQYSERAVIPWVNEGVAEFLRLYVLDQLQMGGKDYRHRGMVREMLLRNDDRANLKAMMAKREIAGTEGWAYAVSYTIIDFMIAADPGKFVKFLKALKLSGDGSFQDRWTGAGPDEQAKAIEAAFGIPVDKFETSWKEYVRAYK